MKNAAKLLLAAFFLPISFAFAQTKTPIRTNASMQGAYFMLKQMLTEDGKDSMLQTPQLKIYTDKYMIYAHPQPGDSLAGYGIGTYKAQPGKVMEYVFFTAGGGAHKDTFELMVNKTPDGYSQVINLPEQNGRKFILTEDYKKVGSSTPTPLDGAWKQVKNITHTPDGRVVTNSQPTQFKVFQSGYFIWANTATDSATQRPVSSFGYGTFKMNGKDVAIEQNINSTYATALIGVPVSLRLKFTGKDSYEQTILWPNGERQVEVYQRLK